MKKSIIIFLPFSYVNIKPHYTDIKAFSGNAATFATRCSVDGLNTVCICHPFKIACFGLKNRFISTKER